MIDRQDRLGWDAYFMAMAVVSSKRSADPSTQVGACIVNERREILGCGYNGYPKNVVFIERESGVYLEKWGNGKDTPWVETKYPYICHAEMNAISNCSDKNSLVGSTIYTTLYPCVECAKLLIQVGIRRVVYLEDKYPDKDEFVAAKLLFKSVDLHVDSHVEVISYCISNNYESNFLAALRGM